MTKTWPDIGSAKETVFLTNGGMWKCTCFSHRLTGEQCEHINTVRYEPGKNRWDIPGIKRIPLTEANAKRLGWKSLWMYSREEEVAHVGVSTEGRYKCSCGDTSGHCDHIATLNDQLRPGRSIIPESAERFHGYDVVPAVKKNTKRDWVSRWHVYHESEPQKATVSIWRDGYGMGCSCKLNKWKTDKQDRSDCDHKDAVRAYEKHKQALESERRAIEKANKEAPHSRAPFLEL